MSAASHGYVAEEQRDTRFIHPPGQGDNEGIRDAGGRAQLGMRLRKPKTARPISKYGGLAAFYCR